MKYLLILPFITAIAISCKPKTECRDFNWNMLFFYSKDTITDTFMHFELYKKGSNFTQLIDSGHLGIWCEGNSPDGYRIPIVVERSPFAKYQFDQYDWSYTFYPSGKRVTQTEITFHQRKEKLYGDGSSDYICANNLTFKSNDSTYSIPGTNGPYSLQAYIELKY